MSARTAALAILLAGCAAAPRVTYTAAGTANGTVVLVERRAAHSREYLILCDARRSPPCVRVQAHTLATRDALDAWARTAAQPSAPPAASSDAAAAQASSEPCTGATCGRLRLLSDPWCNVAIDGEPIGSTPIDHPLEAGTHLVRCTNPENAIQEEFGVRIEPRRTTTLRVGLRAPRLDR